MSIANEEALVCEALVREIGRADRWSAVTEAWDALLHVRRMGESLRAEVERLQPCAEGLMTDSQKAQMTQAEVGSIERGWAETMARRNAEKRP
jgi:NAD-specific glutamate dehydrogenase